MASYQDLTFNNGDYINQYAGLPLQQIEQAADKLSTRHYQNLAQLDNLGILAAQTQNQLLPGAKPYAADHINSINAALQDIARNGGEYSTAKVNAIARAFRTDQTLMNTAQRAKEYNDETELHNKLTAEGFDPVWDENRRTALLNASPDSELYNLPHKSTAQKRLSYLAKQDEILDPLKPDGWEGDLKEAAKTKGMSVANFLQSTSFQGLTSKKVNDYLFKPAKGQDGHIIDGKGWTSYKDTPEYRQQRMIGLTDPEIKAELQSRGEAKVFSHYSKQFMQNPDAALQNNTDQSRIIPMSANTYKGLDVPSLDPYTTIEKTVLDGQIADLRKTAASTTVLSEKKRMNDLADKLQNERSTPDVNILNRRGKYMRSFMQVAGLPTKNLTDAQLAEYSMKEGKKLFEDGAKTIGSSRVQNPNVKLFETEEQREAVRNDIKASIREYEIIDLDNNKKLGSITDGNGQTKDETSDIVTAIEAGNFTAQGSLESDHHLTDLGDAEYDGFVNGIGKAVNYGSRQVRLLQSGFVGNYVLLMVIGILILFIVQLFLK